MGFGDSAIFGDFVFFGVTKKSEGHGWDQEMIVSKLNYLWGRVRAGSGWATVVVRRRRLGFGWGGFEKNVEKKTRLYLLLS